MSSAVVFPSKHVLLSLAHQMDVLVNRSGCLSPFFAFSLDCFVFYHSKLGICLNGFFFFLQSHETDLRANFLEDLIGKF